MRVLFAGTPEVALPTLKVLMDSQEHEVVGVLTRADAPKGRGRKLLASPVAEVARAAGIDTHTPTTLRDPETQEWVRSLQADVAVVVAYGRLVPAALLDVPTHGWLNLHFSLLPAWRGAAPIQHAIMAGDDVTGACVFRLDEGLDTGPVYARLTENIRPQDTSGDLLKRLSHTGASLVTTALSAVTDGSLTPEIQSENGVSLAPSLSPQDALIHWDHPAQAIDRIIRAVTPAPGAHTSLSGERFRLGPVTLADDVTDLAPGQLRTTKREVLVGTGTHAVRLGQVAPAGKNWMQADAWARGARPTADLILGAATPSPTPGSIGDTTNRGGTSSVSDNRPAEDNQRKQ